MTTDEVKLLMKRIKSHYSTFVSDDYKFNEWYNELKNYSNKDVNKKLESHLNSVEFSDKEPQLYFLTRYLKPINTKAQDQKYSLTCPMCNECVRGENFDTHYGRCNSTRYIIKQTKKYLNKDLNRDVLMNMQEEEFNEKYDKLLKIIQRGTDDQREEDIIGFIFNPPQSVNMEEII
jgi:hypothetical protein